MSSIKIVVIIHSPEVLQMVLKSLSERQVEVVAVATNGVEGFNKVIKYSPDIVLLDLEIPAMDGARVLKNMLAKKSLPVIVFGSDTPNGRSAIKQALKTGAMDFIKKPRGELDDATFDCLQTELINKITTSTELLPTEEQIAKISDLSPIMTMEKNRYQSLIVIGTSTGGPRALQTVLTNLPDDFNTPILIVQHMPPGFTKSLAERLNHLSPVHVKEAEDGERIKEKTAYIAPGGKHMTIKQIATKQVIQLSIEPNDHIHRPSVDVLFRSLAHIDQVNKIAVILTGMGKDGKEGIIQLKKHDSQSIIISQSKDSSIVYGMPKAAVETNLVDYTIPLGQVSHTLVQLVKKLGGN
ncbi:MAG TPA: chemotaxis-specific protein-glutamate methyltransferase CheB [Cerasibacillus sp.]|uniref:chemotaxis-specific protein-glutamate methyltransferase CheB n=1 Tax=Cerasibacillus sp. TaxID=2498711 RepID=UPI002F3E9A4F